MAELGYEPMQSSSESSKPLTWATSVTQLDLCLGHTALESGLPLNLGWLVAARVMSGPGRLLPLFGNTNQI